MAKTRLPVPPQPRKPPRVVGTFPSKLLQDCGRCGRPVLKCSVGIGDRVVDVEVLEAPTGDVALQTQIGNDEIAAVVITHPRTWYRVHLCPELQAPLEAPITFLGAPVAKYASGPGFSVLLTDNKQSVSRAPRGRGLTALGFRCPRCRSEKWGSRTDGGAELGECRGPDCSYRWLRSDDWLVFRDAAGVRFVTREAFEIYVQAPARTVRS